MTKQPEKCDSERAEEVTQGEGQGWEGVGGGLHRQAMRRHIERVHPCAGSDSMPQGETALGRENAAELFRRQTRSSRVVTPDRARW